MVLSVFTRFSHDFQVVLNGFTWFSMFSSGSENLREFSTCPVEAPEASHWAFCGARNLPSGIFGAWEACEGCHPGFEGN